MQSNNPVCLLSGSIFRQPIAGDFERLLDESIAYLKKFDQRTLKTEWKKETFNFMAQAKSDWCILDCGSLRWDILKYCGEETAYISDIFPGLLGRFKERGLIYSDTELITLSQMPDEEFSFYMEKYIRNILNLYDEERIILIEYKPAYYATNGVKISAFEYEKIEQWISNFDRGFRYMRARLPKAHVIEFPEGANIGDERHKWGKASLHFIPEYYDYALEAVDIITGDGESFEDECAALSSLKERYSKKIHEKYQPVFMKCINNFRERDAICFKMTKYENYMKELLLDEEKILSLRRFFISNRYNHCAFYGLTEMSELFMSFFVRWGIEIDYIVEESKEKEYKGVRLIRRGAASYPETQVMIITDVVSTERIRSKLKQMVVPFPVFDVYEIRDYQEKKISI